MTEKASGPKRGLCVGLDWGNSSLTWAVYNSTSNADIDDRNGSNALSELQCQSISSYIYFNPTSDQILFGHEAEEKLKEAHLDANNNNSLPPPDNTATNTNTNVSNNNHQHAGNVIFDFFSLLGHKLHDSYVQEHLYLWPFKVVDHSTQSQHTQSAHINPLYRIKSKKFQSIRVGDGMKGGIGQYCPTSRHRHHRHNDHLYFEGSLYIDVLHNHQHRQYSIEDLLFLQLQYVLHGIETTTQGMVEEIVVAVSNNTTLLQHRRLQDIIQQLGIARIRLETPSTIAFATLYLQQQEQQQHVSSTVANDQKVLICDIGSRSVSVTVANTTLDGVVEVLSTSTSTSFGGEYITDEILKLMLYRCRHQLHDYHMIKDPNIIQQLRRECEHMKISLSTENIVSISLPHLLKHHWFVSTFTRKELDALCQPLYQQLRQQIHNVLQMAKLAFQELSAVHSVGQTANMPGIQKWFADHFPNIATHTHTLLLLLSKEYAVAQGCLIKSLSLNNEYCEDVRIHRFVLLEVLKSAISVETIGGVASQIIPANTVIPVRKHIECTTNVDQQTKMLVSVYEGNRAMIKDNVLLYQHLVTHLPAASRSRIQLDCILEVDADYRITLTFRDKHPHSSTTTATASNNSNASGCYLYCKDILSDEFHYIIPSTKTSIITSTVSIDRPLPPQQHRGKAEIHLDPALLVVAHKSKWSEEEDDSSEGQDIAEIYRSSSSRPVSMAMSAAEIVSPKGRSTTAEKRSSVVEATLQRRRHSVDSSSKTVFSKVRNLVDKFSTSTSSANYNHSNSNKNAVLATPEKLSPPPPQSTNNKSTAGSNKLLPASEHIDSENSALEDERTDKEALLAYFQQTEKLTILTASLQLSVFAHAKTLDTLVGKTKECPTLVWLYPKRKSYRNWLEDPTKMLFTDTMMLVFICPVTLRMVPCGPKGLGYPVNTPKEFVKKWGPAILLSVALLHAGVMAGRVMGIPLPAPPSLSAITGGVFGGVCDALGLNHFQPAGANTSLQQMWTTVVGIRAMNVQDVQSSGVVLENALKQGNSALPIDILKQVYPLDIMSDAYKSIHTFVTTGVNGMALEDQLRGKMERIRGEDGEVDWVSEEGKQVWLAAHRMVMSPPTSPIPQCNHNASSLSSFAVSSNNSVEASPVEQCAVVPLQDTPSSPSPVEDSHNEFATFLKQEFLRLGLSIADCNTAYDLLQQECINSVLLWENLTVASFSEILQEHKARLKKGVETALLMIHQTLVNNAHQAHGRKSMHQRGVNSLKPDELATLAALKHLEEKLNRLASASHANVNTDYSIDIGNGQMLYSQQATSSSCGVDGSSNEQVVTVRKSAMFRLQRQMVALEQQVMLLTKFLQDKEDEEQQQLT